MRILVLALAIGCADAVAEDEAQDAVDTGEVLDGKADTASCSAARCGDPRAPAILFPGNPACPDGCERLLASDDVYVPLRNGKPWGDTYKMGSDEAVTLAGYSSGRIALLRRLALVGDGQHAVMLDPSWDDGARDFTGRGPQRGEEIVRAWLRADPDRTFLLIYSTRSVGWDNYADLADSDVGDQVRVCAVAEPHLRVPRVANLAAAFAAPDEWDNGNCR